MLTNQIESKHLFSEIINKLIEADLWFIILQKVLVILLIIVGIRVAIRMGETIIQQILSRRKSGPFKIDERRVLTLGKLLTNILSYTLSFIGILLVLEQLGINLMPLLAGAGVVGLAIGFGAQNLVRDVITGFFIIFEHQFAVGDVIKTGQYEGTVMELGLRITRIKAFTGEIHIIPNGSITEVTNYSRNNSIANVDLSVAYEEDVKRVILVLEERVKEIFAKGEIPELVSQPKVLGVQSLGPSEIIIRINAECQPMTHGQVKRKLNQLMKETLEKAGIEIPYPRLVTIPKVEGSGSAREFQ